MELKWRCPHVWHRPHQVLIVPLWKWNLQNKGLFLQLRNVLIVPLWNWNILPSMRWHDSGCYNRTFMELKSGCLTGAAGSSFVLIAPLWNWNSKTEWEHFCGKSVLIAPLWNWNMKLRLVFLILGSSNRTFMELKFDRRRSAECASRPF